MQLPGCNCISDEISRDAVSANNFFQAHFFFMSIHDRKSLIILQLIFSYCIFFCLNILTADFNMEKIHNI